MKNKQKETASFLSIVQLFQEEEKKKYGAHNRNAKRVD